MISFVLSLSLVVSPLLNQVSSAFDGSNFNPGYIISDEQFFNGFTLSDAAIQEWLNAQMPYCDTNGTGSHSYYYNPNTGYTSSSYSDGAGSSWVTTSRSVFAQRIGAYRGPTYASTPFICLKSYHLSHGSVPADTYCQGVDASTNASAATVIMKIARSCNISPKVILVLLQKEQGLVTDDWPITIQYTSATGYACPDNPLNPAIDQNGNNCEDAYEGFFNQVYFGARQFQRYRVNAQDYSYRAGRSQNILYNPNTGCGSSPVYIQNQATAGLYNYTPYQPNAAALANLNGTGDGCSAYGNRNFWRMFYNWWGDPAAGCQNSAFNTQVLRLYDPKTFNHLYTLDYCEANKMKSSYGFILEGPVFNTVSGVPNASPIYRMYNPRTGLHHYVTNQAEIDAAVPAGYHLEGAAFWVAPPGHPGSYPVYRLYNPKTFIHLWVTSQADINGAVPAGYHLEGLAWYAT